MLTVRAWPQFYGRRPIYICSFTFFLIWLIPCAFAHNIQTMLVARFLDGLAGSAFLSVAGGTVGDMFNKNVSVVLVLLQVSRKHLRCLVLMAVCICRNSRRQ